MFFPMMRTLAVILALCCLHSGVARAQAPPRPASKPEAPTKVTPASEKSLPAATKDEAPAVEPATPSVPLAPTVTSRPDHQSRSLPGEGPEPHAMASSLYADGVRERSWDSLLLPKKNLEVGGEMTLLTSKASLGEGGSGIGFTDIALLLLKGRYSFGPVELGLSTELLVKQPGYTSEYVPQQTSLTARAAIGAGQAGALHLTAGPLLAGKGLFESGDLVFEIKRAVHETLVFQGGLGGSFTHLNLAAKTEKLFWLAEVLANAEVVLRTPNRGFALWAGAEMRFPVVAHPRESNPDPSGFLDPGTCLNVYLAAAYTFVDRWDVYARLAIIDRGDASKKESTLPILDGGFDQQQVSLGLIYHFDFIDRKYVAY